VGLVVSGIANYVFLTVAGRALGPERFAPLSVLWASLYLVGYGLYFPFEQELTRAVSASIARDEGHASTVRRVGLVAAALYAAIALVAVLLASTLADRLFGGQSGFVVALVVGIGGIGVAELVCGVLAGTGLLRRYGSWFLGDALLKAVPVVVLAASGVRSPIAFGCVIALSALLASVPAGAGVHLGAAGRAIAWRELVASLGYLLLAFFLGAVVMNIGTIAVELLASTGERAKAGVFLSGLVIARVPLTLFLAAQVVLLPRLTTLVVRRDFDALARLVRVLAWGLVAATLVVTLGAAALGPWVVRLLFGGAFDLLSRLDMALLALATMLMVGVLGINQTQIALHRRDQTPWPWAAGVVAFVLVVALTSGDLFHRVGGGMVASGAVALVAGVGLLRRAFARARSVPIDVDDTLEPPAPPT
jgi:O-antigen/teichoic acid export membrane protein